MSFDHAASRSHLVIIPSYNSGPKLIETVRGALRHWQPVWVVIDGSTDDSAERLEELRRAGPGLRVLRLDKNEGKGAAVLHALITAQREGFASALVMDSDGQHPAERIPEFMRAAMENPQAMILGEPRFGPEAPWPRQHGRRLANWWVNLETFWGGIRDSLFGFRVYPVAESVAILQGIRGGRRYDFDTQLAVRLSWAGFRAINIPVPVTYFTREQGGVSHFHYVRDNALLVRTHAQLVLQIPWRLWQRRAKELPLAPAIRELK